MECSAGIIPYRFNDGNVEFFVGHPTGAKDYWAYLKGRTEEGESWIKTAIREFNEESGQNITFSDSTFALLGVSQQRKNKKVIAFGVEYPDIDPSKCFSNLIENSDKPEVDKYAWMTYDELCKVTHPKHIMFYDEILRMIETKK